MAFGNACNRSRQLKKIHYLAEILTFENESESAPCKDRINFKVNVIYLLKATAYDMYRLVLENQHPVAPGAIAVEINTL